MMPAVDSLCGNPVLHRRLCQFIDILRAFVRCAPQALDMHALQRHTGLPVNALARPCSLLWQALMIAPAEGGGWRLLQPANQLTLEQVYRCIVNNQGLDMAPVPDAPAGAAERDSERFIGQAALAVNQAIARELATFTLDRLRFDGSARTPFSPHFLAATRYDAGAAAASDFPPLPEIPPSPRGIV